jgi:hypothetical protein
MLYRRVGNTATVYIHSTAIARVQSWHEYHQAHDVDTTPENCVPANVLTLPGDRIHRQSIGPLLAPQVHEYWPFWTYLKSLGGKWMWDYIQEGEIDVTWISTALANGSFISVADVSYDRDHASMVSGSGWVICCAKSRKLLQGFFFEI